MHTRRFRRGVRRTARVRRVASYTKGQCSAGSLHSSNRSIAIQDPDLVYLIQSQACCQLHQGAPKTVVRLPFSVIRNPLWAPSARRPETFGQRKTDNGKRLCFHGAEGARTPDLLGAIQALSQLSYSPAG